MDGLFCQHRPHKLVPDGRRPAQAIHFAHRLIIGIARPDPHHQVGCVPDRPVVVEVGGRAGLDRRRAVQPQQAVAPKPRRRASLSLRISLISQATRSSITRLLDRSRRAYRAALLARLRTSWIACGLHPVTAVGKSAVGSRQLEQAHRSAAQGQRQIVLFGSLRVEIPNLVAKLNRPCRPT